MPDGKPNILVIGGDDIGISNLSCYSDGLMGYRTASPTHTASKAARPVGRCSSASFSIDPVVEKLHEYLAKD
nr:hypothetical protein [Mycolicibacterium brisbanense]